MTETVSNSSEELPPADPGRLPDDRLHAALKSVIAIANDVAEPDDVAQEVVDRLVAHLELGQARIYLLTSEGDSGGHTHLELAAAAGSHAAITRDMPSVALDAETDIARVADSGDPEFHGDMHGLGQEPEGGHEGLGRWRASVKSQSSAVLPLAVRDRALGVLSLEWSAPRSFDEPERDDLISLSSAIALVVETILAEQTSELVVLEIAHEPEPLAEEPAPAPEPPAPAPDTIAELEVTEAGQVFPSRLSGDWAPPPLLKIHVRVSALESDTDNVFWDAPALADGRMVLTLGKVAAPLGGAARIAETARHMLRASLSQGLEPDAAIELLGGWLAASGSGSAWISALVLLVDTRQRTATWCAAGSAGLLTRYLDGRSAVGASQHAPLGASGASAFTCRDTLLLPGDRLALACGDVDTLGIGTNRARVMDALAAGDGAEALLGTLRSPGGAGGAIVAEVAQ